MKMQRLLLILLLIASLANAILDIDIHAELEVGPLPGYSVTFDCDQMLQNPLNVTKYWIPLFTDTIYLSGADNEPTGYLINRSFYRRDGVIRIDLELLHYCGGHFEFNGYLVPKPNHPTEWDLSLSEPFSCTNLFHRFIFL